MAGWSQTILRRNPHRSWGASSIVDTRVGGSSPSAVQIGGVHSISKGLEDSKRTYARSEGEIVDYICEDRAQISLEETITNVRPTLSRRRSSWAPLPFSSYCHAISL